MEQECSRSRWSTTSQFLGIWITFVSLFSHCSVFWDISAWETFHEGRMTRKLASFKKEISDWAPSTIQPLTVIQSPVSRVNPVVHLVLSSLDSQMFGWNVMLVRLWRTDHWDFTHSHSMSFKPDCFSRRTRQHAIARGKTYRKHLLLASCFNQAKELNSPC